jgi:outer membrane protein OmpA-like peptidoglycan-associated protein
MKKITIAFCVMSLFVASCKETTTTDTTTETTDTAVMKKDEDVSVAEKQATNWDKVDFGSPIVKYNEITSKDVDVRGNEQYSIYGMGEEVLFATGQADIKSDAKACLGEVCSSISQHYPNANIRVYGYTDATGTAGDNKELSKQRAEAVKNYLVSNCGVAGDKIATVAEGESKPAATNANEEGRQQNRRVRIVAMK